MPAPAPRLLIVDDDPDILLLLKIEMDFQGYETTLAADGIEALYWLREHRFDLVVLDLGMPTLDGFGVLETISDWPATERPKVIVVSAWPISFYAQRSAHLGAALYLEKPFEMPDLREVVRSLLPSAHGDWAEHEVDRPARQAAGEA